MLSALAAAQTTVTALACDASDAAAPPYAPGAAFRALPDYANYAAAAAAIERVAAGLGVPVRPTGKATRAAVVARVGEGRWVYPEAAFSVRAGASAQGREGGRHRVGEDAGPDEPDMEAPFGEGAGEDEPPGDAGGEDGWLEQAYDEGVAEVA